jgi:glutamyl-tRNA synthetase
MAQLVVLHPNTLAPLLPLFVLGEAGEKAKPVKVQGVGVRNCPVAQLKVNATTGEVLFGEGAIGTYLARHFDVGFLGASLFEEVEVQQWLSFTSSLATGSTENYLKIAKEINTHLSLRTFVVGYKLTLADLAVWSGLLSNFAGNVALKESNDFPHLKRFLEFLGGLSPRFAELEKLVKVPESKASKRGDAFLQLKGNPAKGKVCTRFPPEPSGYMHVGHCKAAMLNHHYATSYEGQLVIRMDDTNPSNEKDEFSQAILDDLKSLGITGKHYTHTSDHFDTIIDHCEKLLKEGRLFVDECSNEDIQKQRQDRVPSPFRDRSIEDNLKLWQQMKDGSATGLKCVVRAKIQPDSNNGCLRDPNVFRCVPNVPHPRKGNKYKVYPLYDFACPIVDSVEGVTHALRSSEYHDHNYLYDWVLDACKLKHRPIIEDFSRLNFTYTILSKRKLQWFVNNGLVEGWNDPCFPTVRGVLRRGLTVEALRKFILQQGSSKNLNLMDMSKLWALNKQIIDPIVPRYTVVIDPVPFVLSDAIETEFRTRDLHKKNPSLGTKAAQFCSSLLVDLADAATFSAGEEITLMDWGNCIIEAVEKDGDKVTKVKGKLHLAGDYKLTKKKITWVADAPKDLLKVTLMECHPLLTKPKLEKDEKFEDYINKPLKTETIALGEPALRVLKEGDKIQLERRGYYICDRRFLDFQESEEPQPLLLINIPDGRQKAMRND